MLIKMWYTNSMGKIKGSYYMENNSTHKVCPKCGGKKERSEFHKDKNRNDGLAGFCKECLVAKNKKWRENNPERMKEHMATRIWYKRKISYGLSKEDFFKMLQAQDNKCAICKMGINESCHVDHCHDTNIVRGLLCGGCNTGIGMLQDNPDILEEAARYMRKYM
jgi:hypothetical protein